MPSRSQIYALGASLEFEPSARQGFVGLSRVRDGVVQRLDIFQWSNAKHADRKGIPRAYLVLCPGFDMAGGAVNEITRIRVPLVEWPSPEQARRRWANVAAEVVGAIGPLLDGTVAEVRTRLGDLPFLRYSLDGSLHVPAPDLATMTRAEYAAWAAESRPDTAPTP